MGWWRGIEREPEATKASSIKCKEELLSKFVLTTERSRLFLQEK